MPGDKRIKVLIAKPGLDGHDKGAKLVANALRDAGMEVIYTGLRQAPQQIARTALEEDVEIIGLSFLSGAHLILTEEIIKCFHDMGLKDRIILVGGVIPTQEEVNRLKSIGVHGVFPTETPLSEIIEFIHARVND